MTDEITTTAAREQACNLVLAGFEGLRRGLLMYHELGLTTKEIYEDLKKAGWDKSVHFLRRQETSMRKEGLLPETARSLSATKRELVRKSAHEPVEKIKPQPINNSPKNGTTTTRIPRTTGGESGTSAPVEDDEGTVTVYHAGDDEFRCTRTGSDEAERDYDDALAHIDAIVKLTKKYFHGGWSTTKWAELRGESDLISECCRHHGGIPFSQRSEWNPTTRQFDEKAS
tara:strand:- start:444 stop:1127 length:684 start_codon:yes stop_codon:yes gene_type:complete